MPSHTVVNHRPVVLFFLAAIMASPVHSQPGGDAPVGWELSVGAGLVVGQETFGSEALRVIPVPAFDVRHRSGFYANPNRGLGFEGRVGPVQGYAGLGVDFTNRDPEASNRLQGLRRVPETAALKTGVKTTFRRVDFSLDISSRLGPADRQGTQFVFDVGSARPLNLRNPRTILGGGAFVTAVDGRFADQFLSVTAQESARSGLAPFEARGGLLDAGLRLQWIERYTPRWSSFVQVSAAGLLGDAADSPVVETSTRFGALLFLQYRLGTESKPR